MLLKVVVKKRETFIRCLVILVHIIFIVLVFFRGSKLLYFFYILHDLQTHRILHQGLHFFGILLRICLHTPKSIHQNHPLVFYPIIIKFIHFHKRQNVYKNKRKLKGTGITVTESLTSLRLELYHAATAKFGRNTVWTTEERILTKINNEILCIKDLDMLESLESL